MSRDTVRGSVGPRYAIEQRNGMRFSRTRYAVQSALVRGREQPAAPLFAVMPSKCPAENVQVAAYSESCKNLKDLKFHRVATNEARSFDLE